MKRIFVIIVLLSSCIISSAQEGLYVEGLFEGEIIPRSEMKQTFIRGASLQPYKLDTFKSISFTVGEAMFKTVEMLVQKDVEAAPDKNTEYVGGHLTYAVATLPQTIAGSNRYLCFQAKESNGMWVVTIVYLRGSAHVEDLNQMFNKRKR